MANKQETETHLHEYAGGWISERTGTEVPAFLKYAYVAVAVGTVSYLILYIKGETGHSERGSLVEQFNRATENSPSLIYMVAAMAAIFFLAVILFAFRNTEGE